MKSSKAAEYAALNFLPVSKSMQADFSFCRFKWCEKSIKNRKGRRLRQQNNSGMNGGN